MCSFWACYFLLPCHMVWLDFYDVQGALQLLQQSFSLENGFISSTRGGPSGGGGCGGGTDNVAICQFVSHVKAEEEKRKKSLFWRPLYD